MKDKRAPCSWLVIVFVIREHVLKDTSPMGFCAFLEFSKRQNTNSPSLAMIPSGCVRLAA